MTEGASHHKVGADVAQYTVSGGDRHGGRPQLNSQGVVDWGGPEHHPDHPARDRDRHHRERSQGSDEPERDDHTNLMPGLGVIAGAAGTHAAVVREALLSSCQDTVRGQATNIFAVLQ
jgi:hypothetical protein